ncbi:hypothetical protein Pla123a_24990 [Posidoniimonas polymericola]|uniref:SLA1 homology domain-containing protein n=2 Tax=Posidoniimonas polymericola TaxID=2528002 RepID=A0A5C5YQF0_9BACT|nr:hypothetical protein Pla123a_24990 [Posidoniimonas polymericola]
MLLEELGEKELAGDVFRIDFDRKSSPPTAIDMVRTLLEVASPTPIRRYAHSNQRMRIEPIEDFDAFCDAIDFGKILAKDDDQRFIRLRVDPAALTPAEVHRRAREAGKSNVVEFDEKPAGPRVDPPIGNPPTNIAASPINPDGFSLEDPVECQFNGVWVRGVMVAEEAFDTPIVRFDQPMDFLPALTSKRFARVLRETPAVILPVDPARLRPSSGSNAPVATRTWTDKTGRFSIQGSLVTADEREAVIRRADGRIINVPIEKLSEQDQSFLKSGGKQDPDNPFQASEPSVAAGPLRPNVRDAVKALRNEQWDFEPTPWNGGSRLGEAHRTRLPATPQASHALHTQGSFFHSDSTGLVAIQRLTGVRGGKNRWVLDIIAPEKAEVVATVPAPVNSTFADVLLADSLALIQQDRFGAFDPAELFVQRIVGDTLHHAASWRPYGKGVHGPIESDVEGSWFIDPKRVMTMGRENHPLVVWDWESASAERIFTVGPSFGARSRPALDARRQLFAYNTTFGISVIDLKNNRYAGDLVIPPDCYSGIDAIAIKDDQRRLAATAMGSVLVWDLSTGEQVRRLTRPEVHMTKSIEWVGEFLLVDGRYLYDVERAVLLWEFQPGLADRDGAVSVAGSRLWYFPGSGARNRDPFIDSIELPRPAIVAAAERLGSADDLMVYRKGDPIELAVDIPPEVEGGDDVRSAMEQSIRAAGLELRERADTVIIVACEPQPQRTLHVIVERSRRDQASIYILDDAQYDMRQRMSSSDEQILDFDVVLYNMKISIVHNGETLYTNTMGTALTGRSVLRDGETVEESVRRRAKPYLKWINSFSVPSSIARPGTATKNGAYGYTRSSVNGQLDDYSVFE